VRRWTVKKLKTLLFTFACVTTCVVFVTAVYTAVFWPRASFGSGILWQILFVSLLCSLGIYIYPEREVSKRAALLLHFGHYLVVNVVVLGCGIWFEWFYADNFWMVSGMVAAIALVFFLVSAVLWKRDRQMAVLMNERLKEYQQEPPDPQ